MKFSPIVSEEMFIKQLLTYGQRPMTMQWPIIVWAYK